MRVHNGLNTLMHHGRPAVPDSAPESPLTELAAAAAQLHELFVSYVNAGFTENQALRIVIGVITGANGGGQ